MSVCACGCGQPVKPKQTWVNVGHATRKSLAEYVVDAETGCWVWQRAVNGDGYGSCYREGRIWAAHRWYYIQFVGPVPSGLELDHLCRNRRCVNPDHLEPVTTRENILRGEGCTAQAKRKTHCLRGHEFTRANTMVAKDGGRRCLTCHNARGRAWRETHPEYWLARRLAAAGA